MSSSNMQEENKESDIDTGKHSVFNEKAAQKSFESLKKHSLHSPDAYWAEAFVRHKGLFTNEEQTKLRNSTVAIAGLGAVGATVFLGLVRSGVGSFIIADFDIFEAANLNRQVGARPDTLGRKKTDVLLEEALRINPFLQVRTLPEGFTTKNAEDFLQGADIVVDAMDFFAYNARLSLLTICRKKNLFVVTSGNAGFGASLLVFDPHGIELEKFLGVSLKSSEQDLMAAFALSSIPRHFSASYTDPAYVSLESKVGPATGAASLLAGAMIITEVLRLLSRQSGIKPVPHFVQIDVHEGKYIEGVLHFGNRSMWQRIRRYVLINRYWGKKKGFKPVPPPGLPQERVLKLPIPERVINAILTAGIQAPSGDNVQPWTFKINKDTIQIAIDGALDESYFNYGQIPSLISLGCVLENMRIAASSYGLHLKIENIRNEGVTTIATIHFELSTEPRDPLFNVIWERNTNRRLYTPRKISENILLDLQEKTKAYSGVIWHHITDAKKLTYLAKAVYLVDMLRSERKDLHVHFQKKLRFTQQSVYNKKDGFPLRNLKAGWHGELFLKVTHPWWIMKLLNYIGFSRAVARFAYQEILSSSACVLLTVPSNQPTDLIIGGQALERVWLEATHHDLAFQPMATLPIFLLRKKYEQLGNLSARHKKLLDEAAELEKKAFPDFNVDTEDQIIMFRLGYAKAIEVGTLRKPLDSFLR